MTIDHEPSYLDPDPIDVAMPVRRRFRFAVEPVEDEPGFFATVVAKITETHERPHATVLDRYMGPWIGVLAWLTFTFGVISVFFQARPSSLVVPCIALGLGYLTGLFSVFAGRCRGVNTTRVALIGAFFAGLIGLERYLWLLSGH